MYKNPVSNRINYQLFCRYLAFLRVRARKRRESRRRKILQPSRSLPRTLGGAYVFKKFPRRKRPAATYEWETMSEKTRAAQEIKEGRNKNKGD